MNIPLDTLVGIAFLFVCMGTGLGWSIHQVWGIVRPDPAPEPRPEPDAVPIEPHWADLARPLDAVATVDDILTEFAPPPPPPVVIPIIPGRDDQWTDVIDRDPVDEYLVRAVERTRPAMPTWVYDNASTRLEFLDIADELDDLQDLLTQIVDAHLYDAEETQ